VGSRGLREGGRPSSWPVAGEELFLGFLGGGFSRFSPMALSRGAVLFFKLLACLLWLFELSHGERLCFTF